MKKSKIIKSSKKTKYKVSYDRIKDDLYTISVKYIIHDTKMSTPLLYYRISDKKYANTLFDQIVDLINVNKENLCIDKMKNWIFNIHIIRFLLKSRN